MSLTIYGKVAFQHGVKKIIAHSHNSALRKGDFLWAKKCIHNFGKYFFTKYSTSLWACSKIAAEFMFSPKLLKEKGYTFIPNGIDIKKFGFNIDDRQRVRVKLGVQDAFVIGNIGRLCYQKNQTFLLDILLAFKDNCSNAVLLLAGDGPDEQALRKKAAILGLSNSVIFYGITDTPWELYSAMDVFVLPSFFEGFGIVAVEARESGLPVLCSENIPAEAIIASKAKSISVADGVENWVREIERIREQFCVQLRTAGDEVLQFSDECTCNLVLNALREKE